MTAPGPPGIVPRFAWESFFPKGNATGSGSADALPDALNYGALTILLWRKRASLNDTFGCFFDPFHATGNATDKFGDLEDASIRTILRTSSINRKIVLKRFGLPIKRLVKPSVAWIMG